MHLFLLLLVFAIAESMIQKWQKWSIFLRYRNTQIGILGLFTFFFIGVVLYPHENLRDLLLGVWEKQHGILLPIGLIWLGILLSFLEKSEMRKIGYTIIASGTLVALVALIEKIGYNTFTWSSYGVKWSWWEIRSTSTLGNPNYVAGYLLMILPVIVSTVWRFEKYILIFLLSFAMISTKSVIGITVACIFFLFLLLRKYGGKKYFLILAVIIITISVSLYLNYHDSEKWLSFTSRLILMKYTLIGSLDSLVWIVFGHGPDAIIRLYSSMRPLEINAYFPEGMIIDSSHNIFIDIFMKFGVFGLSFIAFILYRWKDLESYAKQGLIFWGLFFFLNVIVVSHWILLVFFSFIKKPPKRGGL